MMAFAEKPMKLKIARIKNMIAPIPANNLTMPAFETSPRLLVMFIHFDFLSKYKFSINRSFFRKYKNLVREDI